MALLLTLGRGVLTGVGKHPSATAPLPPTRLVAADVRIDPRRVAAYASVCGFSRPDGDRGLPLTYPHVLGFPLAARIMAARDFPLPLAGLVHTSVDITGHAALTIGDRPELTVYAAGLRAHRRGTEVVMVTQARVAGALVWEDRSTYLARHGRAERAERVEQAPGADLPPDPDPALPVLAEWRLPADLGRRHARVSGDYNPIHLSPLTARPFGFRRAVAHGMWTVARCVAQEGGPGAGRVSAEFRRAVVLPSAVRYLAGGGRFEVRTGPHVNVLGRTG